MTTFAAATLPVLSTGTAFACSCSPPDPPPTNPDKANARNADYAFSGSLIGTVQPDRPGDVSSSGDPVVYTFAVERVYKGSVAAHQRILTAAEGASCGLGLFDSGLHLVFAHKSQQAAPDWLVPEDRSLPWAGDCEGTRMVTAASPPTLGPGYEPQPDPEPEPESALGPTTDDGDVSSNLGLVALAGGLLIAGGAVILTRKRRHP